MKTKLLFLSILFSFYHLRAQETTTYLPIFSETDTTTFCYFDQSFCFDCTDEVYWFSSKFVKDESRERTYKYAGNYPEWLPSLFNDDDHWGYGFSKFTVSEDNARLWGYDDINKDSVLLMDLNLEAGDTFEDVDSYYSFTVSSVYRLNGRKHIKFNLEYGDSLVLIEGVGATRFPKSLNEMELRAKYINNQLEYGVPSWYPFWGYGPGDYTALSNTVENDIVILAPTGAEPAIKVIMADFHTMSDVRLSIFSTTGRLMDKLVIAENKTEIDIRSYPAGIYIARLSADGEMKTLKFVKQ